MRFLADMGIGLDVVISLRTDGHDALHLRERGLERLPDDEIRDVALSEDRVILTHDLDFSRMLALTDAARPSLISFRLSDMRPATVTARLQIALAICAQDLEAGAVVSVTDGGFRVRRLPFSEQSAQ